MLRPRFSLSGVTNVIILVAAAILVVGSNSPVRVAFSRWSASRQASKYIQTNWKHLTDVRTRLGMDRELADLVMFTDYSCPYCQQANALIESFLKTAPDVTIAIRYLPVTGAEGERSARAAICAMSELRLEKLSSALYRAVPLSSEPDYVGLARSAGVADSAAFSTCFSSSLPQRRLQEDIQLAHRIGIAGTPSFLLPNGTLGQLSDLSAILKSLRPDED